MIDERVEKGISERTIGGLYTRTHCPSSAACSAASSTRWAARPSAKLGEAGAPSRIASTKTRVRAAKMNSPWARWGSESSSLPGVAFGNLQCLR